MDRYRWAGACVIAIAAVWHLTHEPKLFGLPVQARMATTCITPYLQCPLTSPVPVGSPCSCMTPQGLMPGTAN